ncbi:hypothetical protein F5J12DRAFT_906292 [Pisolithus orientalis]|uniref:uncharacterized protein n=1 Tax=Pisolithus orientalis TaxID=936130 RepID=UPI002225900B|nr:uncharacterized protein F5J12DRAFT_906292 [Pisolithus orientalis]KAI6002396.1 hypothetical protein F5J12DRAFT_906292 [Pisolithus orientalis]
MVEMWKMYPDAGWLCFGLTLHTGIKPFSGHILWTRVWHSNCNPQLILSYYLDTVKEFGCTKNFGIANAQTLLWQMHDLALEGYVQHRWMHIKKNIKPEITWSQLHCHFSPCFESLLDMGVDSGWYDPNNMLQLDPIHSMVFQWVFIPWLQVELNNYQDHINNQKHHDKRKVLPHGILELIYTCPEDYGVLNFKALQQLYINPNHIMCDLMPPSLKAFIEACYFQLGSPSVGRTSTWTVYCNGLMQHLAQFSSEEDDEADEEDIDASL